MSPTVDIIVSLAREAGASDEAVRKWAERGRVAHTARTRILALAVERGVDLPLEAFDAFERPRQRRRRVAA
jgi:hypothetical protein